MVKTPPTAAKVARIQLGEMLRVDGLRLLECVLDEDRLVAIVEDDIGSYAVVVDTVNINGRVDTYGTIRRAETRAYLKSQERAFGHVG